jgi:hypothetical protein
MREENLARELQLIENQRDQDQDQDQDQGIQERRYPVRKRVLTANEAAGNI